MWTHVEIQQENLRKYSEWAGGPLVTVKPKHCFPQQNFFRLVLRPACSDQTPQSGGGNVPDVDNLLLLSIKLYTWMANSRKRPHRTFSRVRVRKGKWPAAGCGVQMHRLVDERSRSSPPGTDDRASVSDPPWEALFYPQDFLLRCHMIGWSDHGMYRCFPIVCGLSFELASQCQQIVQLFLTKPIPSSN